MHGVSFKATRTAVPTLYQPKGDETVRADPTEAVFDPVRLIELKRASPRAICRGLRRDAAKDIARHPW